MPCGVDEVVEFVNGPVDGLEIPIREAISDAKIIIFMSVKLNAQYAARYIYCDSESQYLYVDTVALHTINSGKVINRKEWE